MKWYEAPIVVVDFETTGFQPPQAVVEVGAVRYEGGTEVDRLELLVRPRARIEPGATCVHGFTDDDVAAQPYFEARYPLLREFFTQAVPASYGAYDQRVLRGELGRMVRRGLEVDEGVPAFSRAWGPWLDLLGWARRLYPGPRRKGMHTLGTMAEKHGIELARAHRAIDDAAAAAELLWAWRDQLPDVGLAELLRERLPK